MNNQLPTQAPQTPHAEDQHQQMARFGITVEQKAVYRYQSHIYDRLADAVAYAAIDTAKLHTASGTPPARGVMKTPDRPAPSR